jgi:hypothetical protein
MNNQPVAWRIKDKNDEWLYYDDEVVGAEPLYTHPAKTLTDEEIEEVFVLNCNLINETFAYRDFARALLRKAQEK